MTYCSISIETPALTSVWETLYKTMDGSIACHLFWPTVQTYNTCAFLNDQLDVT